MTEHTYISRRQSIVLGGTALTAGLGGLALGTDRAGAQADVSVDSLSTEPATLAPEDGEVYSPWLILSGAYSYELIDDPAEWQVYLLVGDGSGGTEAIAITNGPADAREDSGAFDLRGSITTASFWSPADFAVDGPDDTTTVDVPYEVVLVVQDDAGGQLVTARAGDTAEITVEYGGSVGTVGGEAKIRMQDDESDPAPEV
jgi:hypothetical protein